MLHFRSCRCTRAWYKALYVLVGACVYTASVLYLGCRVATPCENNWPYSLAPLPCVVFVSAYMTQMTADAFSRQKVV